MSLGSIPPENTYNSPSLSLSSGISVTLIHSKLYQAATDS